ncbi:hypothetical protein R1sor_027191 [Riccia sorocarpa]|uniref:Uncharacterized protein n=1 Tax=Riccia sorocarpa TaxID=122646 RepID=A0ABD3GE80_9MARC
MDGSLSSTAVNDSERIRRDLERFFGPEEVNNEIDQAAPVNSVPVASEDVIPITTLSPAALFHILEDAGILKLPVPTETEVRELLGIEGPSDVIDGWGVWRTEQIILERDHNVVRLCYRTSRFPLDDTGPQYRSIDTGPQLILTETLWDGTHVPAYLPYGTLLGSEGELYRAGIEVGEQGLVEVEVEVDCSKA